MRVAQAAGFALHAGVLAEARERQKLERLCRYIARRAVATQRLSLTAQGQVRYPLKTPYRDGTTHVLFEPVDFIARLAALVPKPRVNPHPLPWHLRPERQHAQAGHPSSVRRADARDWRAAFRRTPRPQVAVPFPWRPAPLIAGSRVRPVGKLYTCRAAPHSARHRGLWWRVGYAAPRCRSPGRAGRTAAAPATADTGVGRLPGGTDPQL